MNSTSSENDAFGDVTLEGIMSGTSNTAIGDDPRRFLVDGSGNVKKVSAQLEMSTPATKVANNR